eukprot:3555786-Alexandrium_andersonii.AAC.1
MPRASRHRLCVLVACRCSDAACRLPAGVFFSLAACGCESVCVCVVVFALLRLVAFVATLARPLLSPFECESSMRVA